MTAVSDEEYAFLLSMDERAALAQFRTHLITKGMSNRKLMLFLFARKLDVIRAVTLLTKNLAFRELYKIPETVEREHLNEDIVLSQVSLFIPNTRDKEGRGINYFFPSRLVPGKYPIADFFTFMMYLCDRTQFESPDYHRKGIIMIEDLQNVKLKNFDYRLTKKHKGFGTFEDIFPARVQAIYLLHPPIILKALIKLGKLLVKQKIMKRIQILPNKESLLEFVEADQLHEDCGGRINYPYIC